MALRRDECKIRQDGRESLSLSWFQLINAAANRYRITVQVAHRAQRRQAQKSVEQKIILLQAIAKILLAL